MENYIKVPVAISGNTALNLGAKMLYGAVAALCNNKGFCWANNSYLAKTLGVTTRSITRYLAQLRDAGLVYWTGADQENCWVRRQIRVVEPEQEDAPVMESDAELASSGDGDESSYTAAETSYNLSESSSKQGEISSGVSESSYSVSGISSGVSETSTRNTEISYRPSESSSKTDGNSYAVSEASYRVDGNSYRPSESSSGTTETSYTLSETSSTMAASDHGIPKSETGIPKSGQDMAASVHPASGRKPKSAKEQVDLWLKEAYPHWAYQERKLVSQTMEEFLAHRKLKGCPIGRGRTLATLCDRVAELGEDNPRTMADVLVWAMLNGWKNLFSIRNRDEMDRR